jgi:ribosome modulation factor
MPLNDGGGFDTAGSAILNPYKTEPQRSRWAEGFAKAMGN